MTETTDKLLTPADLADYFGVTVAKVMEWNRTYQWPRTKVGRTYRWTQSQLDAITRKHQYTPTAVTPTDGRTKKSAAKKSA